MSRGAESHVGGIHLRWAGLTILAIMSAAIWYATITRLAWLPTFYLLPHLDTPKLLGVSAESFDSFARMAAALLALYLVAWRIAGTLRGNRALAFVLVLAAVTSLPLVMTYPVGAGDVYAYVAEADMVLRFHLNPFAVPVSSVPAHPLLPFLDFPDETTHYGPLWLLIGLALRLLSGADLLVSLVVFKVAAVLFLIFIAWMVYLVVRRDQPDKAVTAALLVAWNPLMVFEVAANGHNDVAMMALVAFAFFLQSRGARRGAVYSLVAACLVKYVAVLLIPLFLLVDLRGAGPVKRWLPWAVIDAVGIGAFVGGITEIVGFEGSIGILQRMTTWFTTSPGAVLYFYLSRTMPQQDAGEAVGQVTRLAFVALYACIMAWVWFRPSSFKGAALGAMLAFMFVETVWFQPWYVAWALPIAALMASPVGTGFVVGMGVGGVGIHLIMGFGWRLWWLDVDKLNVHAGGATAMWLPVLAGAVLGFVVPALIRHFRSADEAHYQSAARAED